MAWLAVPIGVSVTFYIACTCNFGGWWYWKCFYSLNGDNLQSKQNGHALENLDLAMHTH